MSALAQGTFDPRPALELRAAPGVGFITQPDASLGGAAFGFAGEVGVALPRGSFFGYALRLRAESTAARSDRPRAVGLSLLAEAQVEIGLEAFASWLHPRFRGGIRAGQIGWLSGESRIVIGPHLLAGVGVDIGDGAEIELGAGTYVSIGPFELVPCLVLGLRAPIAEVAP